VTYVVQSGDTLSKIAAKFGVTISDLLSWNPEISDPNLIRVGQVLVVANTPDYQTQIDELAARIEAIESAPAPPPSGGGSGFKGAGPVEVLTSDGPDALAKAYAAGHRAFLLEYGTHTQTKPFEPRVAVVVMGHPIRERRFERSQSAHITTTGQRISDYIKMQTAEHRNLYGGYFANLSFDPARVSRSAIFLGACNNVQIHKNKMAAGSPNDPFYPVHLVNWNTKNEAGLGNDGSWITISDNQVDHCALAYHHSVGHWTNGIRIINNDGIVSGPETSYATIPYVYIRAAASGGRNTIANNAFETMPKTATRAAIYLEDLYQTYVVNNGFERLYHNRGIEMVRTAGCVVVHSEGTVYNGWCYIDGVRRQGVGSDSFGNHWTIAPQAALR
jgi:LysM repeat protein